MYRDVMLAMDPGDESSWATALPKALEFCRCFDARLHLISVVPGYRMSMVGQFFPEGFEGKAKEAVRAALNDIVAKHIGEDVPTQCIVGEGTIYKVVLETAADIGADLIIVAAHRPELEDYLLGPNAARVVRHADCSVLVVRD